MMKMAPIMTEPFAEYWKSAEKKPVIKINAFSNTQPSPSLVRLCPGKETCYKDKCLFKYTTFPFFGKVMSRYDVNWDPCKQWATMEMPLPKTKKNYHSLQQWTTWANPQRPLQKYINQIGLGTGLLQVWDGINFVWDYMPDNSMLRPRAFAGKGLSKGRKLVQY